MFLCLSGYNPIFDESFEFQINLPELALVRFAVLDDDYIGDEFIGQYTLPFECMQTGEKNFRPVNAFICLLGTRRQVSAYQLMLLCTTLTRALEGMLLSCLYYPCHLT